VILSSYKNHHLLGLLDHFRWRSAAPCSSAFYPD